MEKLLSTASSVLYFCTCTVKIQASPLVVVLQVGDFGLSRIKRNTLVSGGVRGTLPWMAPELLNGSSNRVSEKVILQFLKEKLSYGYAMAFNNTVFNLTGRCFLFWNFDVGNLDWGGTLCRYALWCHYW